MMLPKLLAREGIEASRHFLYKAFKKLIRKNLGTGPLSSRNRRATVCGANELKPAPTYWTAASGYCTNTGLGHIIVAYTTMML
jgi:hypothetical protein